jgi:hypothetical protein
MQASGASGGLGVGINYSQGESRGTAGMGSANHHDNWAGANQQYRASNYNNGSNYGYGGNHRDGCLVVEVFSIVIEIMVLVYKLGVVLMLIYYTKQCKR